MKMNIFLKMKYDLKSHRTTFFLWRGCIDIRVSQIAGVFQKMIFESCTLFHIMPFAKIIGPVEKNMTKS